ncbi:MAG: hypothetical protein ABF306_09130 [Nocardioides marinisabuli]|uniref:hypothetical protein n=1 Tax=Nocardioides marinisabuli TaxID=419476 RepID=UPI00321A86C8
MGTEQSRGAPLKPLDDPTPLGGPTIDVGVRVGWLLRMARLTAPERPAHRLGDMVTRLEWQGLSTSTSSLHRVETGVVRDDRVVAAYEEALALAPGSLRAAVDIVCRTFPYSPVDRAPLARVSGPEEMSRLHAPVLEDRATGGQWRGWARSLSQPGNVSLPVDVAQERVRALMTELVRAQGPSYVTRYDALATLRRSEWGGVVRAAAAEMLADPHVQVVNDLMSAVGEASDPATRSWLVDLLGDTRDIVVQGAAVGLSTMAESHGSPDFWGPVLDLLVEHYNDAGPAGARWHWLSHLLRLVPPADLAEVRGRLGHAPAPVGEALQPEGREALLRVCQLHAEEASAALGLPYQPLLARLLHEFIGDGRSARSQTSGVLLAALPSVNQACVDAIVSISEEHPDPWLRERAASRVLLLVDGYLPARVRERLVGDDLPLRDVLWAVRAHVPVSDASLRRVVDDPETGLGPVGGMHAAGLAGWPLLGELADDPEVPEPVRGAARWWLRIGSHLRDPLPDAATGQPPVEE